jgi:hypothetical protein
VVYHVRVECQDPRTLAHQASEFPGISCEAVLAADETVEYYAEYYQQGLGHFGARAKTTFAISFGSCDPEGALATEGSPLAERILQSAGLP